MEVVRSKGHEDYYCCECFTKGEYLEEMIELSFDHWFLRNPVFCLPCFDKILKEMPLRASEVPYEGI